MKTSVFVIGALAASAAVAAYVLTRPKTVATSATPVAPAGMMWGQMLPQNGTVFTFAAGTPYLLEADASPSANANLTGYLQSLGFNIVQRWAPGQLPVGWPGSQDANNKLRFYVISPNTAAGASLDGMSISGLGAFAPTPSLHG